MMNRAKALVIAATVIAASAATAHAQLTEYVWDTTKTGSQQWQNAANWAPAGFPNGPLQSGNLSRPLGANLNVDIGSGVTTAGVVMGGTAAVRTTEISSSAAGLLTFRNEMTSPTADFNGSTIVDGFDFLIWQRNYGSTNLNNTNDASRALGDANVDTAVNDVDYTDHWRPQFGAGVPTIVTSAFVHSVGTAGSVNRILSNIHLNNDQLDIAGTNNLTINGNLTYNNDLATPFSPSVSALRVIDSGLTVTMNGGIVVPNVDEDPAIEGDGGAIDLRLNTHVRAKGKLVLNGVISGAGDLEFGFVEPGAQALSTIELNGANTFTGDMFFRRGNFVLGSDNAIGINPGPLPDPSDDVLAEFRPDIDAALFGSNFISTSDTRNIRNNMILGGSMTIKGEHSLTLSGGLTQTNNRFIINVLPPGKTLTLSGHIDIWEDDENLERRWEIDGTGTTRITGSIGDFREASDPPVSITAGNRQLVKRGSGVLVVDVAAGANTHLGPDVIYMGNMHYATNNSLNPNGLVLARGGAVGVDTGVANNATFASAIDPASRGGLMLAASDAGATLDFTSTLANAANMTVAAPNGTTPLSPYNFTGTITPAGSKYQLGGGTGTIRLGGAQLTGGNNLEVRNGGTVQLFGLNTYSGSTTLLTKYTTTRELQAAGDNTGAHSGVYYSEVAPTVEVNKLANGGVASSLGSASSAAANIFIQGSTLRYVGAGDSTDRLFTIGTGGATIESSGTGGPVNFTNAGALGRDDAEDKLGDLDDFTGTNDSLQLYNVSDTSDIIVGMTVSDPDPGGIGSPGPPENPVNPPGPNPPLIPGPSSILNPSPTQTTVTGVSDDGRTLGLSASYGFRQKLQTRLVFGTVPRTLTLGGSNTGANTLTAVISNSAKGGVVNVTKTGAGTWILGGANTYTGTTTVSAGTLIVNGVQTGGGATTVASGGILGGGGQTPGNLTVASGGTVDPGAVGALAGVLSVNGNATLSGTTLIEIGGTGPTSFDQLNMTGTLTAGGVFDVDFIPGYIPASGHSFDVFDFTTASGGFSLSLPVLGGGLSWNTSTLLTTGTLSIGGPIAAVPEPATATLVGLALVGFWRRRREALRRG